MNTIDTVKPNLVPMVLYLCKKCGRRFACETPQHEADTRTCPYCYEARAASGAARGIRKAGSGISRGTSAGKSRVGSGISRAASHGKSRIGSGVSRAASTERPRIGSGVARTAGSGSAVHAVRDRTVSRQGWAMSVWLICTIGAATAALLLLVVFFFGGTVVQAAPENGEVTSGSNQNAAVQTSEQSSEKVLDAERKATAAFTELESRLALLPAGDSARRRALCQEFLREHGNTIVASRVRVLMDGK